MELEEYSLLWLTSAMIFLPPLKNLCFYIHVEGLII